ncbi:AhpC/TSA family protein [Mucilaginibacter sp. BJC16-A38]|uniref:TlpA disulfide reductase family protein n=1 Tax=Mucilaginibacter phenanthrenivorans TaxID=1234842 RepID=UPI002157DB3E|nr:TlpA disulfide reductase family protein [Mucilaginibacter phenanthrenivorans]MCR8557358.1 AhpC/TSA family protein [Mucilaginibacter phenanthrenivorans]
MSKPNPKKTMLLALCLFLTAFSQAQNFHVRVDLQNPKHHKLNLLYLNDKQLVIDSGKVSTDGTVNFTGKISTPVVASLIIDNPDLDITSKTGGVVPGPVLEFVLNNENINIKGSADHIDASTVSGISNRPWSPLRAEEASLTKNWRAALRLSYEQDSQEANRKFDSVSAEKDQRLKVIHLQSVQEHPDAILSSFFLYSLRSQLSPDSLEYYFLKLGQQARRSIYGEFIAQKIQDIKASAIGAIALPVHKADMKGNIIDLENFKDHYILLDFWGSWCVPCRESHPHLIGIYNQYKSRGLIIIGIAQEVGKTLGDNEQSWKDAVKADNLPWLQVLNNREQQQNDIIKAYDINSFPAKILIGKDGKIIGRYTGDDAAALEKKLTSIFD